MNVHWARSNKIWLAFLAATIGAVGGLTTLVLHQQHDQATGYEHVQLETGISTGVAPKAETPEPAIAPRPAPPVAPAAAPETAKTPTQQIPERIPARVIPAPRSVAIPHKSPAHPRKQAQPVSPPRQPAPLPPVTPAPETGIPAKETPPDPGYAVANPGSTGTPNTPETASGADLPAQAGVPAHASTSRLRPSDYDPFYDTP